MAFPWKRKPYVIVPSLSVYPRILFFAEICIDWAVSNGSNCISYPAAKWWFFSEKGGNGRVREGKKTLGCSDTCESEMNAGEEREREEKILQELGNRGWRLLRFALSPQKQRCHSITWYLWWLSLFVWCTSTFFDWGPNFWADCQPNIIVNFCSIRLFSFSSVSKLYLLLCRPGQTNTCSKLCCLVNVL